MSRSRRRRGRLRPVPLAAVVAAAVAVATAVVLVSQHAQGVTLHDAASSSAPLEASYQAGAGIVADSVPQSEHEEVLAKSGAMARALELAGEGL